MLAGEEELIWNHEGPAVSIAVSGKGTLLGDGKELAFKSEFVFFIAPETRTRVRSTGALQISVRRRYTMIKSRVRQLNSETCHNTL